MVIEARLGADNQADLVRLRREWDGLVTIEPEAFDLLRLRQDHENPLEEFRGTIYQGHFERGWTTTTPHGRVLLENFLRIAGE